MDLCAFILNLPTWLERRRWEKEDEKRKKTNKIMENKENFKLKDFRLRAAELGQGNFDTFCRVVVLVIRDARHCGRPLFRD